MVFTPPDHVFPIQEGLVLTFGGEKVQVIYPGPTQAPDKVAVYFPARRLLFGSCMILGMDQVGNVADADLKNWPEAIKGLENYKLFVCHLRRRHTKVRLVLRIANYELTAPSYGAINPQMTLLIPAG